MSWKLQLISVTKNKKTKETKASDVNHELTLSCRADVEPGAAAAAAAALSPAERPQIAVKSRDMMKMSDVLPASLSKKKKKKQSFSTFLL